MFTNIYCTQIDVEKLQNECKNEINKGKPAPRCIKKGQINVKHFIYHNQKLRNKIQNLQQTLAKLDENHLQNKLKSTIRKLNNRELQLKELRKRIDHLNQQIVNNKIKINELTLINSQFQQNIKNLETKNENLRNELHLNKQENINIKNKTQQKIEEYVDEINDLNTIIKTLEPNEISGLDDESEEESNQSDHDREMTEPRSPSSSANTQDKHFVIDDIDSNANCSYRPDIDESSSDDDMDDKSSESSSLV